MSGGSYNYAFGFLNDFIDIFKIRANTSLRKAFLDHLEKVSQAMYDIELVDSGDYSCGMEDESIKGCLGPTWKEQAAEIIKDQIRDMIKDAEIFLETF